MEYKTPQFSSLGSLTTLTLGMGGSCLDGGSRNNNQLGGGSIGGEQSVECGPGTGPGGGKK